MRHRLGWDCRRRKRDRGEFADRTQHLAAITEDDAKVFQILIRQVAKNREINAVFDKALGILGHAELLEPVPNLLHRGPVPGRIYWQTDLLYPGDREFIRLIPHMVHRWTK